MDDRVYFLAKEINEELVNNPDVILLNELDKELNNDFEVYQLYLKKDRALKKYVDRKELFGEDDPCVKEARLEVKAAKEELNNHPLVRRYLEVYSRVRDLYLEINNILLDDFSGGNK